MFTLLITCSSIFFTPLNRNKQQFILFNEILGLRLRLRLRYLMPLSPILYFSYIGWSDLLVEETRVPRENHQPVAGNLLVYNDTSRGSQEFAYMYVYRYISERSPNQGSAQTTLVLFANVGSEKNIFQ